MQVTATMVKTLRERTGAGMMDCKKFLQKADGDIEQAVDLLRQSGQIKAAKKSGRVAGEGAIRIVGTSASGYAMLEVNCETDFVAKDEQFLQFVENVSQTLLQNKPNSMPDLSALAMVDKQTIEEARLALVSKIGENIQIRRFEIIELQGDTSAIYLHGSRIGVLIDMKGGNQGLAKDIAMHIAACHPLCIDPNSAPAAVLKREKAIFKVQASESGKPEEIVEKIIIGKVKKFLCGISLLEQPFVKDSDKTVGKLLKENNASVCNFYRYEVAEGIEKKQENFVDEVMAQVEASSE